MHTAAAYLRCSSPGQATGDTFPRQCEATEDYADEHRLTVLAAFPEPVSGTKGRKGGSGNRGRPIGGEGSSLNVAIGRRSLMGVGQGHTSVDAG
jgi:hypothetical protein